MGAGGCVRSYAGGTGADDGAVLSLEKSLTTNYVTFAVQRFYRNDCCGVERPYENEPLLRLQYRADEGEACP